MKKIAVYMI